MRRVWLQLTMVFGMFAVVILGSFTPVAAQDGWSWIVTPQLWGAHIEKNGFTSSSTLSGFTVRQGGQIVNTNPFKGENSQPVESLYPQWGVQIAAQKDRWTLAGAFQYVSFETRSDIIFDHPNPVGINIDLGPPSGVVNFGTIAPGERLAQEFIDTTRIDLDLAASYLFPDVVPNRLDLALGAGVKVIYAEATREFSNRNVNADTLSFFFGPGLYRACKGDDFTNCRSADRVKTEDWLYGGTFPMSATIHLTNDAKWLLPLSFTPFIGAETRDDRDVVYRQDLESPTTAKVDRLDGTTFAYGVTADATIRYLLSDTVSVYGGGRVQYIKGHEEYLAYGPIIGMSVRFGGK